jgi:uncharacterized protein (TIGR03437 family)
MNWQKPICLGFVLSIFGLLGTAHAQQPWTYRLPWETRGAERQINSDETETASFANANVANKLAAPEAPVWVQSAGPETGNAFALLRTNTGRLLMGTFGGLFISDDNGENWAQNFNIFANGRGIATLAKNDTAIFAGANNNSGIFRSTNNGATWTAINNGFPAGRPIHSLITNGNNVIAVTFTNEVYVSNNNGDAWVRGGMGLPATISGPLLNRIANNNGIFYLTNLAEATPALYRSTDNGMNWVKLNPNLPAGQSVSMIAANGIRAFLGVTNGPPRFSDDGGQTWHPFKGLPTTASGRGSAVLVTINDTYALLQNADGSGTLYASTDSGETWKEASRITELLLAYSYIVDGQTLFLGNFDGVARSQDGGKTFVRKNRGLRSAYSVSAGYEGPGFAQIGTQLFVRSFGAGVWSTSDAGMTWKQHKQGVPEPAIVTNILAAGTTLYACTEQPFGIYRSTDRGETWTAIGTSGLPPKDFGTFPNSLNFRDGKLYVALDEFGLFVSEDSGNSFKKITGGLPNPISIWSLAFKDNTLFVTTNGNGLFRSTDGGATFTAINTGLTTMNTRTLVSLGNRIILSTGNGLYRSTDNGDNWTRLNALSFLTLAVSGNRIHGAGANGVQSSRDNGDTWQTNFNGLFGSLQSITASGNNLVVATAGNGILFQPEDVSSFAVVSAASFNPNAIAARAIVSAFGVNLAPATATAGSLPLPVTLGGVSVKVKDANGTERDAPLFFVSSGQLNFQIPTGTANGAATITVTHGSVSQTAVVDVFASRPALFAANATGAGPAAAIDALTGTVGPFNPRQANGQPNILAVFGSGLGGDATDQDGNFAASVTTRLAGGIIQTLYAGRAPGFTGLNQINLVLPANIPAGTYALTVTRGNFTSNTVTITIR